uniref:Uncharacterized protein n=1 Tax=Arundo donax TaxID=35708 RepID=A0A0A9EHT8_ARUDO
MEIQKQMNQVEQTVSFIWTIKRAFQKIHLLQNLQKRWSK